MFALGKYFLYINPHLEHDVNVKVILFWSLANQLKTQYIAINFYQVKNGSAKKINFKAIESYFQLYFINICLNMWLIFIKKKNGQIQNRAEQ